MATIAEWISFYVAEHGREPQSITQFMKYVQNRHGPFTYREVREAFQAPQAMRTEVRQLEPVTDRSHWQRVDGFGEGGCCAICLADDNDNCIELNCGGHHRFHLACMGSFVSHTNKSECPTCRRRYSGYGVSANFSASSGADASHEASN